MTRYYITDSRALGGTEALLRLLPQVLAQSVDMIQVREKHLSAAELLSLTRQVLVRSRAVGVRVLVNGRVDVALAAGADGVHLPAGSPAPRNWKGITPERFSWAVSCHSVEESRAAEAGGADWVVFSPVFASPGKGRPQGLDALAGVARGVRVPVLALGGIEPSNIAACLAAGAAGVAGIRLFQGPSVTVSASKELHAN